MPVIFGSLSKNQDTLIPLKPPRPQHSQERYVDMQIDRLRMGAWVHRGVREADAVFQGIVNGKPIACLCDAELVNTHHISKNLKVSPRTGGNAELMAMLIGDYGIEAFLRFDGAFRCAAWYDDKLYLAVDRFGAKRLSYLETGRAFLFGSKIDWLGSFSPQISLQAISLYIQMAFIPTPGTIFQDVKRLAAGSCLVWEENGSKLVQYWQMHYPENLSKSEEEMAHELRAKMESSLANTVNGLPVGKSGCYLSGGTDSSTILGLAAKAWGQAPTSYTIGFAEESFSETYYSRLAARHFGAKAHEKIIDERDGWRAIPALIEAFDQPFGNSSSIGAYFCAEMAAGESVDLLLAGDGGDELFGGNERYAKDKVYRVMGVLPQFVYKNVLWDATWAATREVPSAIRLKNILHRATLKNPERFYMEDTSTPGLNSDFYTPELVSAMQSETPLDIMRGYYLEAKATNELNRLLYIDLKLTITDNDLVKVTDTAAACGVRVRYPFLSQDLVEFSGRMPADMKVKGLNKRFLFKRALRDFLPPEILKKTKHGFGVPVSTWFRNDKNFRELINDIASDKTTSQRGYLNPLSLRVIVDQHERGLRDWSQLLWSLTILELWLRKFDHGE